MYATDSNGVGNSTSGNDSREINSITRAAKALMDDISRHARPNVHSGEGVVYSFDMGKRDGLDRVIEQTARLAVGRKLRYRNGVVEMYELGSRNGVESVEGNLLYLMRHASGYLKLMDADGYFDVNKFDLSIYTKADSVSFSVTLYRA